MSNLPSKELITTLTTQLSSYEKKVLPDLLEKHGISPAQFVQVVLSEVKKNEKLMQAFKENPASVFASVLAGAEIGLMPSDLIGEFYLIPRSMKGADGKYRMTATPMVGYKGLVSILLRSGDISKIHTEIVYEGDDFDVSYGLEQNIVHKPNFNVERTAAKITHAYAVAKFRNGEYQFAVMSRKEIEAIRDMSKNSNGLYFNDRQNPARWMEKKCVLIQLSKMLPKDYYSKKAISLDQSVEGGSVLTLDENNQIKIVEGTPIKPMRFRQIYSTLNAPKPEIPESPAPQQEDIVPIKFEFDESNENPDTGV
jgi:recombination protein RecT